MKTIKFETSAWFSMIMARKLIERDPKYPDGWEHRSLVQLFERAREEYNEAEIKLQAFCNNFQDQGGKQDDVRIEALRNLILECGDVANFMMMVAERAKNILERDYEQDTHDLLFAPK